MNFNIQISEKSRTIHKTFCLFHLIKESFERFRDILNLNSSLMSKLKVTWYLRNILICISMMGENVEYFLECLLVI